VLHLPLSPLQSISFTSLSLLKKGPWSKQWNPLFNLYHALSGQGEARKNTFALPIRRCTMGVASSFMKRVVCPKCGDHPGCPRTMTLSERGSFVALKRWDAVKSGKPKNGSDAGLVSCAAYAVGSRARLTTILTTKRMNTGGQYPLWWTD
jgi:hypothetical protein